MTGQRYQPDELLRLRESPLVQKPATLPPAEDWMGPPADQPLRKARENARPTDIQPRRPGLTEQTRHMSRGSNTVLEDIVLGPPKTSFASASSIRSLQKGRDTSDADTNESSSYDRYHHREISWQDKDRGSKIGDGSREPRFGSKTREGDQGWAGGRFRKSYGQDEFSRLTRRTGNGEGGETQESGTSYKDRKDPWGVDRERRSGRREPAWMRDEESGTSDGVSVSRDNLRHVDWRERHPVLNKDSDRRGGKAEREPEWMEPSDHEETRKAHTAEEFERWKEQFRASSNKATTQKEVVEPPPVAESPPPPPSAKVESQLELDANLDRLFGLWKDPAGATTKDQNLDEVEDVLKKELPLRSMSKTSRFTSLFSPAPPPPAPPTQVRDEPSPIPQIEKGQTPEQYNADQEGFQRILQMLRDGNPGSAKSTPTTQSQPSNYPVPPEAIPIERKAPRIYDPNGPQSYPQDPVNYSSHLMGTSPMSPMIENLLHPRQPTDQPSHNESEYLLRLMQARVSSAPVTPQATVPEQSSGMRPGVVPMPEYMGKGPASAKERHTQGYGPGFFDDPAIAAASRAEMAELQAQQRRRQAPNVSQSISADALAEFHRIQSQAASVGPRPQIMPPGLQRPPGFEQFQSNNWQSHQYQGAQQSQVNPPPGFQNINPRSTTNNSAFISLPPYQHMQMPNERSPVGRSGVAFPPPGMGLPGFHSVNPPPGFMPSRSNTDSMTGISNPNPYTNAGVGADLVALQQQQRYYQEMLAHHGEASNARGGPLGQYR